MMELLYFGVFKVKNAKMVLLLVIISEGIFMSLLCQIIIIIMVHFFPKSDGTCSTTERKVPERDPMV